MIMVKKKTTKKVIDYDPLAWLDENDPADETDSPAPKKQSSAAQKKSTRAKKVTSDKSTLKPSATAENPGHEVEAENEAFGFFDDAPDINPSAVMASDNDEQVIGLGAELTIRSVREIKAMIDTRLQSGFDINLDAQALQKIDTAGVQMIYSLFKTLQKRSQVIHWQGVSPLINQAATKLGLPALVEEASDDPGFGFFDDEPQIIAVSEQEDPGYGFF